MDTDGDSPTVSVQVQGQEITYKNETCTSKATVGKYSQASSFM
jgi:hypothetical protein